MKHIFIINPKSGATGKSYELISVIQNYFADNKGDYEIITTEGPGHATEIAAAHPEAECVYSIGGDGTAYEILNGLPKGVALGIIPAGSGNDYYEMVGYPSKHLEDILIRTIQGRVVEVDYGIANGHKFLNCFCTGIDAEVVEHANLYSKKYPIPNKMSYLASALGAIIKPKPIHVKATIDEVNEEMDVILMAVMNGQYYGGGFNPAPEASIQDGLLKVLMVDFLKLRKIIPLLPKYFSGKHKDVKEIHAFTGKKIHIETDQECVYCCDGEIYRDINFEIEMVEKGLLLKVPEGSILK